MELFNQLNWEVPADLKKSLRILKQKGNMALSPVRDLGYCWRSKGLPIRGGANTRRRRRKVQGILNPNPHRGCIKYLILIDAAPGAPRRGFGSMIFVPSDVVFYVTVRSYSSFVKQNIIHELQLHTVTVSYNRKIWGNFKLTFGKDRLKSTAMQ